jgi:lambda repressor-like predicted transcriptional regulator
VDFDSFLRNGGFWRKIIINDIAFRGTIMALKSEKNQKGYSTLSVTH